MENGRRHGDPPYRVAVVHGGPGAAGEMEPVARELAGRTGVLEPFQTATSVDRQIEELATVLERDADAPVLLVGYSWGALLAALTAAAHPDLVERLVLVGCPPLEERYAQEIAARRTERLSDEDAERYAEAVEILEGNAAGDEAAALADLERLAHEADTYDGVDGGLESDVDVDASRFQAVWEEAADMRSAGALLERFGAIECAVVLVHGSYDSHPLAGVVEPLERIGVEFEVVEVDECGHTPWVERRGRGEFFEVLGEAVEGVEG